MTPFLLKYLVSCLACCLLGVVLAVKDVRVPWLAMMPVCAACATTNA